MVDLRSLFVATRAHLASALRTYVSYEFLPAERRDDDLFLVEFPKSGVTWLTFLVANVNALLSGDQRNITFFNINDFVPDVQVTPHVGPPLLRLPGYRCFKSHSPYIRRYRKTFYLVRDPRHVMVSYWTFLKALGWWRGTLEELVEHPGYGVAAWVEHVSGWLDRVDPAASFTLIRYEDMVANPAGELQRLYQLLGVTLSEEILALAVERSSLERMRESEALMAAGHPALKNVEFVRRGGVGGAREALAPQIRRRIEEQAGSVMTRLGYSLEEAPMPSTSTRGSN